MKNTQSYLAGWLIVIFSFFMASCSVSEQSADRKKPQPINIQLPKGNAATVIVGYEDDNGNLMWKGDVNLSRVFDGNTNTYWASETSGCKQTVIQITLKNRAYLKNVSILYRGKVLPTIGSLSIDQSTDEDSRSMWTPDIDLPSTENQNIGIGSKYYLGVLKGKVIVVGLSKCNEVGGRLEIASMNLDLSDTPTMAPQMTAMEIKTAVKSLFRPNEKDWHFIDDENDPNKEKYLAHLMYYGLHGDSKAEDLFESYHPPGADVSEDQSDLESWYEEDRTTSR